MSVTDEQINDLLSQLKDMIEKIQPLRTKVADLDEQLIKAQRDYDSQLGAVNAESIRLQGRKMALKAAMLGKRPVPNVESTHRTTIPPPTVMGSPNSVPSPAPVQEDPRDARKRALWNHIYFFLNPDELKPEAEKIKTIQAIHGMVKDEQRDLGDMLEVLAWGDIWKARADWETFEDQARRLDEWLIALQRRMEYWQQFIRKLEMDRRQNLLKEMQKRVQQDWLLYLQGLAGQQQQENKRLVQEIVILENEWRARQPTGQSNGQ